MQTLSIQLKNLNREIFNAANMKTQKINNRRFLTTKAKKKKRKKKSGHCNI